MFGTITQDMLDELDAADRATDAFIHQMRAQREAEAATAKREAEADAVRAWAAEAAAQPIIQRSASPADDDMIEVDPNEVIRELVDAVANLDNDIGKLHDMIKRQADTISRLETELVVVRGMADGSIKPLSKGQASDAA